MWSHSTAIVVLSLLLAASVRAQYDPDPIELCREFSIVAREVMTARQHDKPMSDALPETKERIREILKDELSKVFGTDLDDVLNAIEAFEIDDEGVSEAIEGLDAAALEMAEMIVIPAYKRPSYATPSNQRDEINSFENDFFESCYLDAKSESEE